MSDLEDINTLEQTAEYLKLTEYQVKQLVSNGKIGSMKVGRARLFPKASIEAFVKANTTEPTPPPPHGLTPRAWQNLQRRNHLANRE